MGEPGIREKIDVGGIKEAELPEGAFPAAYPHVSFRVWFTPEAHRHILAHSRTNTSIELCGVLVGRVLKDAFGPFALVEDIVRGEHAENQGAQVTFTQQTWAHIFAEMERSHASQRIVGWYHTHPGFGIFLSPMDMFIQENFFNLPWQVAFVVDPLGGDEGLFTWRDGKALPTAQYWVGENVHVSQQRGARVLSVAQDPEPETSAAVSPAPEPPAAPSVPLRSTERGARGERSIAWDVIHTILLVLIVIMLLLLFLPQRAAIRDAFQKMFGRSSTEGKP